MSFSILIASAASAFMLAAPATPSFPPKLVGQWTDNPANCGGEDTSGMRISGGTISFYESVGTATSVEVAANGTITADLSYTGEGKAWAEKNRFALSPDDKTVRVTALGHTFSLRRCPAL